MGVSHRQQTQSAVNDEGIGGWSSGAGGQDTGAGVGRDRVEKRGFCGDEASWGMSPQRGLALPVMGNSGEEVFRGSPLPYKPVLTVSPVHGQHGEGRSSAHGSTGHGAGGSHAC